MKRGKKNRRRLKPYSPDVGGGRYPFVAIVGRPNVGKSTLFNRFVGQRLAIEEPTAGTTRDRLAAIVALDDGRAIEVCDMGGLGGTGDAFDDDVNTQIDLAINYADLVLFLVDARAGMTSLDESIGRRLLRTGKPIVLAANKCETTELEAAANEFYALGIPSEVFVLSAREGDGKSDLLEAIVRELDEHDMFSVDAEVVDATGEDDPDPEAGGPEAEDPEAGDPEAGDPEAEDPEAEGPEAEGAEVEGAEAEGAEAEGADEEGADEKPRPVRPMRLAIVGRRNVGKSTFLNQVMGEERVIASSTPGTTRDAIDVRVKVKGRDVILIDTAGIRKRGRVDDHIELISHGRTQLALRRADAALLFLDCLLDIRNLDKRLAGLIRDEHKACVIVANKWDLAQERMSPEDFADYVSKLIPNLRYAPVVAISALRGDNALETVEVAHELYEQSMIRVGTGRLNRALTAAVQLRRPRPYRNTVGKIFFGTQIATNPVTVLLFVNDPILFPHSYRRFLQNQLRKDLPWEEIPIKIVFRARESLYRKGGGLKESVRRMHALADKARWVDNQPSQNVRAIEDTLDLESVQAVLLDSFDDDDESEDPIAGRPDSPLDETGSTGGDAARQDWEN